MIYQMKKETKKKRLHDPELRRSGKQCRDSGCAAGAEAPGVLCSRRRGRGEGDYEEGQVCRKAVSIGFTSILDILKKFGSTATLGDSQKCNLKLQVKKNVQERKCNYSPLYSFRVNYIHIVIIT